LILFLKSIKYIEKLSRKYTFFTNYLDSKIGKLCTSYQEQIFPEMKYHFKGCLLIPLKKWASEALTGQGLTGFL